MNANIWSIVFFLVAAILYFIVAFGGNSKRVVLTALANGFFILGILLALTNPPNPFG